MGEQAAIEDRDRITEVLSGADMIFLTAGLGGGTGTGALPVVAEVAKETGALTVAIVTLPFRFEGQGRYENAMNGLAALNEKLDALIVVPNDRLAMLCHDNISFLNAFGMADEVLHNGVRAISELITLTGLINLDFADVRTVMLDSGRALMGIGTADGENRSVRAASEAIVCPLLEQSSIDGAMGVIVNVKGGNDLGMKEVYDAVTTVQKAADPRANIIFGAVVTEEERQDVQVTVIAAGFPEAATHPAPVEETVALTLEVEEPKVGADELDALLEPEPVNVTPFEQPEPVREPEEQFLFSAEDLDRPSQAAAAGAEHEPEEDLDIPAFMRRRMKRQ
jgi:cell division protein FtsZ